MAYDRYQSSTDEPNDTIGGDDGWSFGTPADEVESEPAWKSRDDSGRSTNTADSGDSYGSARQDFTDRSDYSDGGSGGSSGGSLRDDHEDDDSGSYKRQFERATRDTREAMKSGQTKVGILFDPSTLGEVDNIVEMLNDSAIDLDTNRSEVVRSLVQQQLAQLDDPGEDVYQKITEYREAVEG